MCVCPYMCFVCAPRVHRSTCGTIPRASSILLFEIGSLPAYSFWPVISEDTPLSSSPVLGLQVRTTRPDFSHECWGRNSASILLTELSHLLSALESVFKVFFRQQVNQSRIASNECVSSYGFLCNSLRPGVNSESLW